MEWSNEIKRRVEKTENDDNYESNFPIIEG